MSTWLQVSFLCEFISPIWNIGTHGARLNQGNSGNILFLQLHITKTRTDAAKIFQKLQPYLNFVRSCMTDKSFHKLVTLCQPYWTNFINPCFVDKDTEAWVSTCKVINATSLVPEPYVIHNKKFIVRNIIFSLHPCSWHRVPKTLWVSFPGWKKWWRCLC